MADPVRDYESLVTDVKRLVDERVRRGVEERFREYMKRRTERVTAEWSFDPLLLTASGSPKNLVLAGVVRTLAEKILTRPELYELQEVVGHDGANHVRIQVSLFPKAEW